MSWRVLEVATISLWGILLAMENSELANAPTNPCYHHIDAAYDCSMYYQLFNPFCLCPIQQGYIKHIFLNMENIVHAPFLASPICIGQARREEKKTYRKRSQS